MIDTTDLSILLPALCAGIIVLLTHVPLGQHVLKRGIIFIDLAVAQIAGLGVIMAEVFFHAETGWIVQLCALVAALLGSSGLYFLGKYYQQEQEALIGVAFVLAATASVLLLHNNPHGGEHLKEILSGQILWVTNENLITSGIFTLAVFAVWWGISKIQQELSFYLSFALAVTISVQLVGVFLVFATLIIPALAVRNYQKHSLPIAMIMTAFAYMAGLLLSTLTDWPTSPAIVWSLAVSGVMVSAFSPKKVIKTT